MGKTIDFTLAMLCNALCLLPSLTCLRGPIRPDKRPDPIDTILAHVGKFGRYQKILFFAMLPFGLFYAFIEYIFIFIAATPSRYWCRVPELEQIDMEFRRNLTAPGASAGGAWDRCNTYNVNWSEVTTLVPPAPGTPTVPCPSGWEFELVDIPFHTIVTERGWVCENAHLTSRVHAAFFAGSIFGCLIFGWMADHCGRIPALVVSNMFGCVGGIATIFTRGFWDILVCWFVTGMCHNVLFMLIYILVVEYLVPRQRTYVINMSIALFYGSGCLLLPWVALWVANWRVLLWLTSAPMASVLLLPFVLPESVRWLLTRGRLNEIIKIFKTFEKVNNAKIPDHVLNDFIAACRETPQNRETIVDLFKSAPLRHMLFIMAFVFMSCTIIFDILARLALSELGMSVYSSFSLLAATQIPSLMWLAVVLDRWGRKLLTCGPLGLSRTLLFISLFMPKGIPFTAMVIASQFCVNMTYMALVQWGTELLPTGTRVLGSNILHLSGFISTGLSPFIASSTSLWIQLPGLLLSGISLLASFVSLLLPETINRHLPQTIADAEDIVTGHTVCWFETSDHEIAEFPRWNSNTKKENLVTSPMQDLRILGSRSHSHINSSSTIQPGTLTT